jgi:hypothetical protein
MQITKHKTILLILLISFQFGNYILYAGNIDSKHKIGSTFGVQIPNENLKAGYGCDIFYKHNLYKNANNWHLHLAANVGFTNYESESKDVKYRNIPILVGVHMYHDFAHYFNMCIGIEVGALYKTTEELSNKETSNEVKPAMGIIAGFFIPISKNINIDINYRDILSTKNEKHSKLGLGLTFSF